MGRQFYPTEQTFDWRVPAALECIPRSLHRADRCDRLSLRYKGGVRISVHAASVLAVAALTGCDGDGQATWPGPPDPAAAGSVAVEAFNEHTAEVDESWEGSAAMAAAEFLRLDERTATRTSIVGTSTAEGSGPETVVVTLDGLLDDSVRAERWTLTFNQDGDTYRLVEARWSVRCQPGRGHQTFTPEPCV
jgi:hypothetical protein